MARHELLMAPNDVVIRPARTDDAADVAAMANDLNRCEGLAPDAHTAESVRRDLLRPGSPFSVLVAERGGALVGYILFHETYNTDVAARGVWALDLYVDPEERSTGIARRLMCAMAAKAFRDGCRSVWGTVRAANRAARWFYASCGMTNHDCRELHLEGDALLRLVAEAGAADAARAREAAAPAP
ncbi:MAG TPA: GNAT family N-acetyltransferase, partial [Anaeromyxobacteraceae bacterium]|nr:GNAT family N-acetyltransferase [Anaeromyxobacteraceae bacterium]